MPGTDIPIHDALSTSTHGYIEVDNFTTGNLVSLCQQHGQQTPSLVQPSESIAVSQESNERAMSLQQDNTTCQHRPSEISSLPQDTMQSSLHPIPLPGKKCTFPFISKTLQEKACQGEYIHLGDFSPSLSCYTISDSSAIIAQCDNSGVITFNRSRKSISSFHEWLSAWTWYEKVLVNHNCALYNDLSMYKELIHNASRKFLWSAVTIYDQKFRAQLAQTKSFSFGQVDHDLYVATFTHSAVNPRTPRCFRCQSMEHKVAECPFPPAPAKAQAQATAPYLQQHRRKRPPVGSATNPGRQRTASQWDPGSAAPISSSLTQHCSRFSNATLHRAYHSLCPDHGSQTYEQYYATRRSVQDTQAQPRGVQSWVEVSRG